MRSHKLFFAVAILFMIYPKHTAAQPRVDAVPGNDQVAPKRHSYTDGRDSRRGLLGSERRY